MMIINIIFSVYFIAFVALSGFIYLPIIALLFCWGMLFDRKLRAVHQFSYFIAMSYFVVSPGWKIKVKGKENLVHNQSYLIASNHQAMLDIALLYAVPALFKWVSKKEVYKIPMFGWLLFFHQDITIDRGSTSSTKKMINDCIACLKKGISVMIFPEGTRSKTGSIGKFKEGAFLTAKMAKADILPVVIDGTGKVMSSSFLPYKQTFFVHILPPISYEEYKTEKVGILSEQVEQMMKTELSIIRNSSHCD